jgi:dTDP-glucose 4,6-dehydratase
MSIIVTGGLGFIGKNFIKFYKKISNEFVINIDSKNYASKEYFSFKYEDKRFISSIGERKKIRSILNKYKPRAIINFAAETHVDRSIESSKIFFQSNVLDTLSLLEECRFYLKNKNTKKFKFIHISTDEVFGSLNSKDKSFTEKSKYNPLNPYAASKASSDHLIRSFNNTYNFPGIITNCSNNFGPFQNKEKFIPMIISNAINKKKIPIYGNGKQIRDWIYVEDHCRAIVNVLKSGKIGESYNIGSSNEITNINLAKLIVKVVQNKIKDKFNYSKLLEFVKDRPGHDFRYSINSKKISKLFNWKCKNNFLINLGKTVDWYIKN